MPSQTHCYDIQDRKTCLTAVDTREDYKSPCGWCYGKKCTGSQSLCEPKKWLLQRGLKLGHDYEDCLDFQPPDPGAFMSISKGLLTFSQDQIVAYCDFPMTIDDISCILTCGAVKCK